MFTDLRSDTVTKPSKEMLEAMMSAPLGDDVFDEDPTVHALQNKAAEMFGMEAALFCPSGTMTNQIAIKIHTSAPGEMIIEKNAHPYLYEGGGIAFNSGVSVILLDGNRGRITAQQVKESIKGENVHFPETQLVSLENTCNRGGGACYDFDEIRKIKEVCVANRLPLHLDGARIFNALEETPETPADYGKVFDTISVCLSKGLGTPMGSLLLGNKALIHKARRIRKVFGGGMRQAGVIAAAGLYALEHNIARLKDDHAKAKTIAKELQSKSWVKNMLGVETNILVFELESSVDPQKFLDDLKARGILAVSFGGQWIRFVTHLDISDAEVEKVVAVLRGM